MFPFKPCTHQFNQNGTLKTSPDFKLATIEGNTTISEAGWSKICHSTKLKQRPFNQGNGIPSFKFQQNKMIQLNDRLNMLQITFNKIEDHSSNDAYFEINIFEFLKIG